MACKRSTVRSRSAPPLSRARRHRGGLFAALRGVTAGALIAAAAACSAHAAPPPAPAALEFGDAFWKHWGDGRAELAGYDLVYPRYGELRRGTAVAIFVTETFSNALRVKSDPGKHPAADEFPVMKLNLVQDFPTGIYDYQLMTSAFAALAPVNGRPAGSLTKVTFSAQEWCGQAFAEALFDARSLRLVSHSYFDGEADREETIAAAPGALLEDALPMWARGFLGPALAPGAHTSASVLRGLEEARLLHRPVVAREAAFTRSAATHRVTVPAGTFETETRTVAIRDGRTWTFEVERAAPHRLVRWSSSDGHRAELLGTERLRYWEMNGGEFRGAVAKLGLTPRPERTP